MKNIILLSCLLILILLTSCKFGINPNDANPIYDYFSCIINTDGTGFMEFNGAIKGIFTPDSQKLLIIKSDGLYYKYFSGNEVKISNLVTYIERISPSLNYVIKDITPEGVFLCDIYGNNLTNVTNAPGMQYFFPTFSSDGNWLMSTYVSNNLYNLALINLQTMQKQVIFSDTLNNDGCDFDYSKNELYYISILNGRTKLYKYQINSHQLEFIDSDSFGKLSTQLNKFLYINNFYKVKIYDTISKEVTTILEGLNQGSFSFNIDDDGTTALIRNGILLQVINLQTLEKRSIKSDLNFCYATLSPDGTKIYANYSRQINKGDDL
jgi:hypothetical protein